MTVKRALIGLVIIAVLLAGGVFVYYAYFAGQEEAADPTVVERPPVEAIAVAIDADQVSAEGRVVPLRHAAVALAGSGVVAEVLVEEGAAVTAGQPILRLDAADEEAALRGAEAGLAGAAAARDAAAAQVDAARIAVEAAELGLRAAELELALASAQPRPEEVALGESGVALAEARLAAATAAQAQALEGAGAARIRAAEAELRAAEAAAVPPRLQLEELRLQDNPDSDDLAEAERAYNAALAAVEAARVALAELQAGATDAQRAAVAGGVAAAAAQRDAAEADLALLQAGGSPEAIAVARAGVSGAEAALAQARAALAAAETGVTPAEAGVTGAEAAVLAAQTALNDRTLVAPFDGTVADLPFGVGEVVPVGVPAAVVADFSGWLVETTELLERDVVGVAVGFPAEATIDALPGRALTGVVTAIGGIGQPERGDMTYPVTVRLDDAGELPLRWGMTAFVTIETAD